MRSESGSRAALPTSLPSPPAPLRRCLRLYMRQIRPFLSGCAAEMSADLGQGMLRQDSLELHAAMSSGRLSAKHSARASAFLGAASSHFQLQPLAEACECGAAPGAPELQGKADSGGFI